MAPYSGLGYIYYYLDSKESIPCRVEQQKYSCALLVAKDNSKMYLQYNMTLIPRDENLFIGT